jgi:hypothetical protein
MCRGIFGCQIKVARYATIVIHISQYSTAGITVESVVEFFVQNALPILFLHLHMRQITAVENRKGLGSVTIALSHGRRE